MKNNLIKATLLLASLLLFGCGSAEDKNATVSISGAWALYPMAQRWKSEYAKIHPEINLEVSGGGAGKGMTDVLSDLVDIAMVSRAVYPEELERGAVPYPVAKDTVVVVINEKAPFAEKLLKRGLKKSEFQKIWLEENPTAEIFGEEGALNVYTRSDACGAAETFAAFLGKKQENLKGNGIPSDPGVPEAVRGDVRGIGYCNLNYGYDPETGRPVKGVVTVPVDVNENGVVDKDEEITTKEFLIASIQKGVYPAPPARDLYFVTKGELKPAAKEFLLWTMTEGQKFNDAVGYMSPNKENLEKAIDSLKK